MHHDEGRAEGTVVRVIAAGALIALALGAGACRRERPGANVPRATPRQPRVAMVDSSAPPGVRPGIAPQMTLGNVRNPYAGDPAAAAEGRQFFVGMNCAGCHSSYAGGGMGPSLRDSLWIYGSSDVQIYSTIAEGRPNGMPAWGARLPPEVIWRLVSYIHTLGTADEPEKPPTPSQRTTPELSQAGP